MECREINNLIMKYLDGDISELELKILNKHRLNCEKCNDEFKFMIDMAECIAQLPEVMPPSDFEEKVMKNIYKFNTPSSVANMLIGVIGMFVFAYYAIIYHTLPLIQQTGIVHTILGYGKFVLNHIVEYIMNFIVYLPIIVENLLILRNILINNYANIMILIAAWIVAMNMVLIKLINFQEE